MRSKVAAITSGALVILAFALAAALAITVINVQPAVAHEGHDHGTDNKVQVAQNKTDEKSEKSQAVSYNYVAQPGDSYSKMARKAVQTYGLKYDVKLSGAQIIYAETNMTIEAESPILDEGQAVSVAEDTIKGWVEKAQKLSDAEESAWAVYVPFVEFNTNKVGE